MRTLSRSHCRRACPRTFESSRWWRRPVESVRALSLSSRRGIPSHCGATSCRRRRCAYARMFESSSSRVRARVGGVALGLCVSEQGESEDSDDVFSPWSSLRWIVTRVSEGEDKDGDSGRVRREVHRCRRWRRRRRRRACAGTFEWSPWWHRAGFVRE